MSLSVVLCTFNEEKTIKNCLQELLKFNEVYEIIIIDDNSTDKTIDIIKSFQNTKIKLEVRENTKGFSSAFIYGLIISNGNYVLRFDVDMYDDVDFFIKSFNKYKNYDFVNFSRYLNNIDDERGFFRKYTSFLINLICRFFLSKKITDYTSCIFFLKKKVFEDICIENTYYANFIIKFVFFLIVKNKKIREIQFKQRKNTELNSKTFPNLKIFFLNGVCYFISIFQCLVYKYIIKLKCFLKIKI